MTDSVTAVRTGDPQSRATLEYTTNEIGGDGAAEAGADYTVPTFDGRPNTGQIIFEPGQAEASFTIPIINDTAFEGSETFAVGLQNPSVGALGTLRTVLVTIVEDDSPAELSIDAAPVTVSETDAIATVTVQRSGDVSGSAAVDFGTSDGTASAGTDYTATSGRLTFAAGQTSQTIAVPILNDTSVESNETFAVTLSNPAGALLGSQTTTVTILNNDLELGDLTRTTAVSGLIQPTTLDWTPDGRYMLVAQKDGVVKVVDDGTLRAAPLIDISDQVNGTRGGRGLLGLAVHPDFPNTPYIYLLYTYDPPETAGNTGLAGPDGRGNRPSRMVRVSVDPGTMVADPDSLVVLAGTNSTWEYTSSPDGNSTGNTAIPPSGIIGSTVPATATIDLGNQDNDPDRPGIQNQNIRDYLATDSESHSIGDLEFGADGYLYLSNGDGTSYNFADPRTVRVQDVNNLSGKVLRIDPITGDGVASNPFYNGDVDSNASKVFYYGMRNPFRVAIDPVTDRPVIGDVGWNSFEEINTGVAGSNFGWPYLEGPNQTGSYQDLPQAISFYSNGNRNEPGDAAAVFPILSRTHGNPDRANAITVGDFYNDNTLIFGDVNGGTLYAATLDSDRQVTNVQVFDSDIPFVVDMKMGPDDRLYGVDLPSGEILRWDA
ncbi:MAG: Calx-beta domain-containing protein [Elainellaceae cyanobacterium]